MHSLGVRTVLSCLSSRGRHIPVRGSHIKKTHKLDHLNEFGQALSKEAIKSISRGQTPKKSATSFSKLDHFSEFGPVLTANASQRKVGTSSSQIRPTIAVNRSESSSSQIDHLDEFSPALSEDVHKKETRAPAEDLKSYKVSEASQYPSQESVDSLDIENKTEFVSTMENNTEDNVNVSSLLNSSRLSSSSFMEAQDILRIPHESDESLPSVTRILSATMSEERREVLARWEREKMSLLSEEGFSRYKAETLSRGKYLHSMLETFLVDRTLPHVTDIEDDVSKRHRVSISQMIEIVGKPLAIESSVSNTELGYSGIVDCVAVINNTLTLIDWKTSEKVKSSSRALYDNPLQVAAYVGAINHDERYSSLGNITSGAVVVVYNSGYPAMTHIFSQDQLGHYWKLWCKRLHQYKLMM